MNLAAKEVRAIASEVLVAQDGHAQVELFSSRFPQLNAVNAYQVTSRLRELRIARGERPVGRKLGFTNKSIWSEYGVDRPNWSYIYDTTVHEYPNRMGSDADRHIHVHTASADSFIEPRIEPEIVVRFREAPPPSATEGELLKCIDGIAHGFEIVQSIFPRWKFTGYDTTAASALHGALFIGPWLQISQMDQAALLQDLQTFRISLSVNDKVVDNGSGSNVLGGPMSALRQVVQQLSTDKFNLQLRAGEIITTGTLTKAFPVGKGEMWSTKISGIGLPGLQIRFV